MNTSLIELSKIIYCPLSKKYEILFNAVDGDKEFVIYVSNLYDLEVCPFEYSHALVDNDFLISSGDISIIINPHLI